MAQENRSETVKVLQRKGLNLFVWMFPYLAIGGICLSVPLTIAVGSYELAMSGLETVGIPVIIASIVLIAEQQAGHSPFATDYTWPRYSTPAIARLASLKRVTVSAYLLLFAVSVWLLTVGQNRPWTYFVVVSLIYALIIFQMFAREFDPRIVLAEVPLVMLNQIYGVTLKYPYYFGWTDIFGHVEIAKITYRTGHTVPESISVAYTDFPLYHIFVSEATYFLGVEMKTALFVVTAIPYVVTAVLLYYLVEGVFRDDRVPALVIVLYAANTIVISHGTYMVTRTMAFVGFVFLLYTVYKRANEATASYLFLLVLMTYFTTTVHQVSMPQIVVLLSGLYVCKRIVDLPRFLDLRTLLLITVIFLSYWILFAWDFVMTLFDIYTRSEHYDQVDVQSPGSASADQAPSVELTRRIRYLVQNYVTIFYSIFGIGVGLYKEHSKYVRTLLLFSLLTLGFFIPSPIRIIGQAMDLFRFDRFMLLVSPFVAIAMGAGVASSLRQVNRNRSDAIRWTGTALVFVLVIAYVFASVTHPLVASDSRDLPWAESRQHLTETEVEGFNFMLEEVDHESIIRSDSSTTRFFRFNERLYQKEFHPQVITNVSNVSEYEGYTVFRSEKFQESGLKLSSGVGIFPNAETERVLHHQHRTKNKIFSNGDVEIYYTNESSSRRARQ